MTMFTLNARIRKAVAGILAANSVQRNAVSVEATAIYSESKGDIWDPLADGVPAAIQQQVVVDVVIANGQSLSAAIDLGTRRLVGIVIPAAWTAANLTFQAGPAADAIVDLYDGGGTEKAVTVGGAARFIALNPADWLGVRHLKLRSGTTGVPVNQAAARTVKLILQP